ncbi:MAG: molybdopterin converting factor subunit 1 [Pseudomonadota bacterium]|nr:molybdopterin converting factor subunit 1 [Pseudomonadota bacterium]
MNITVKFFASLREQIGTSQVQLETQDTLTVAQVWTQVCQDTPLPTHILMAINMQYVDPNTFVQDGDEVAFFPPVTGGSDES